MEAGHADEGQSGAELTTLAELTVEDGIAQLTLRRPEARNGLTPELMAAFLAALGSPVLDEARALVIAGEGKTFCAGADLGMVTEATARGDLDDVLGSLLDSLHASIRRLRTLPIPVVAAVQGAAAGAGIGVAMAADLRVLGRSAFFMPAYVAIGASPDGGVSYALTRALGGPRAVAAFLRNRRLGSDELAAAGVADEVVDDGDEVAAARQLAAEVAGTAPHALIATRRLVDLAPTHSLDEHLEAEAESIRSVWRRGDFSEGASAFLERRPARFPSGAGGGGRGWNQSQR